MLVGVLACPAHCAWNFIEPHRVEFRTAYKLWVTKKHNFSRFKGKYIMISYRETTDTV